MKPDTRCAVILSVIGTLPLLLDLHILRFNIAIALVIYVAQKLDFTNYQNIPYLKILVIDLILLGIVELLHVYCLTRVYFILRVILEILRTLLWKFITNYRG